MTRRINEGILCLYHKVIDEYKDKSDNTPCSVYKRRDATGDSLVISIE